jgi:hypothetical protein
VQADVLEWVKVIGPLVLSWPVVGLVAVMMFRKRIGLVLDQFAKGDVSRAKFGPVEIERRLSTLADQGQQAVTKLNRLNQLMAESRLLELEITYSMFGASFTEEQREKMHSQIDELSKLTGAGG